MMNRYIYTLLLLLVTTFSATAQPRMVCSTYYMNFGHVFVGDSTRQYLMVYNWGDDVLEVSTELEGDHFVQYGPEEFTVAPDSSFAIELFFRPLSAGQQHGTIFLTSNDPDLPRVFASLMGEGGNQQHGSYPPIELLSPSHGDTIRELPLTFTWHVSEELPHTPSYQFTAVPLDSSAGDPVLTFDTASDTTLVLDETDLVNPVGYRWHVTADMDGDSLHTEHDYLFVLDWEAIHGNQSPAPEPRDGLVPREFAIRSAYPNPFNNAVTLELELPARGELNVQVFNGVGRSVTQLYQGVSTPGVRAFTWRPDGTASGVYFVRASFGGKEVATRKVMYLR
jgi:hypothetical protein